MKEMYQDEHVSFSVELLDNHLLKSVFSGRGSTPGTQQFIDWVEQAIQVVGPGRLKVLMDLSEQHSVPLRTQMMMGGWLVKVQKTICKVAIVGGGKAARLLSKGSKLPIVFFDTPDAAETWLHS